MYYDYYTIEYAYITIILVNKLKSIQNLILVLIQFNIAICKSVFLIHIIIYYILLIVNLFVLNRTIDLNIVYKLQVVNKSRIKNFTMKQY